VRTTGARVSFWLASAAVFLANAVLSLAGAHWMLATLQAMTAVLAVLAAIEDWSARTVPPGWYPPRHDSRLS
jgi:hypothetical protein